VFLSVVKEYILINTFILTIDKNIDKIALKIFSNTIKRGITINSATYKLKIPSSMQTKYFKIEGAMMIVLLLNYYYKIYQLYEINLDKYIKRNNDITEILNNFIKEKEGEINRWV